MQQVEVGEVVEGKVTGVKDFGAFVELPGGDVGLVHISQISRDYVKSVSDRLSEGQTVKVKILSFDEVNGKKKISLSIRQAMEEDDKFNRKRENKDERSKSNSFEDMMAKFKRESDEKMSDINQRLDGF